MRAIEPPTGVMKAVNTDRTNYLQTVTLWPGAGDAVGILRGSSRKTNAVIFSAGQPHRPEVFKAASNAFISGEQGLGNLGPIEMAPAFKTASTHLEPRSTGLLVADRGRISCLPPTFN
jgi:hypothetical protein